MEPIPLQYLLVDRCILSLRSMKKVMSFIPRSCGVIERTERQCLRITERFGGEKKVIEKFGNPVLTGFTLPKILWLADNEPSSFRRIRTWMLPKDYIVMRLTGVVATDFSDASGTSMLDLNGSFDRRIEEIAGISFSANPALIASGEIAGTVTHSSLPELRDVPVVIGGADNAASAYGCGVEQPGDAVVSVGTSGTVVALTKTTGSRCRRRSASFQTCNRE